MRILASFLLAAALCGCATITRGTTQNISINTPGAAGAQCTLSSPAVGTKVVVTPATVVVQKGQDAIAVRCSKECFQDGAGVIESNIEGMTAGNVLVGGVIGLGVDAASGAMNKYNSDTNIVMPPIQGCRPRSA
ncbi:MAG: translation initiation factor 2 [Hyphomicrobiaceae bacterium]|nr:translation initiation factor 2 [Hyphomicrobiaceae bacterium]